ncbi:hypothetical protein mRhiFer1_009537 [Rhinolophus ferrumequinum]|uniref:Uncharacterized protein n=1 Tax=Rhinolophus ferrumequinum TaxID=59479 RepID=A0A7J7R8U1_RHIFE|nr:hypothetical protein mRhiFer1_009537 [Rhinolophus ferrumequinum]
MHPTPVTLATKWFAQSCPRVPLENPKLVGAPTTQDATEPLTVSWPLILTEASVYDYVLEAPCRWTLVVVFPSQAFRLWTAAELSLRKGRPLSHTHSPARRSHTHGPYLINDRRSPAVLSIQKGSCSNHSSRGFTCMCVAGSSLSPAQYWKLRRAGTGVLWLPAPASGP